MKHLIYISVLILSMSLALDKVNAANRIKVATIGGGAERANVSDCRDNPQMMVDRVISYWKKELAKVLPHKPDLILLTEACDRPSGLTVKEQFEYYKVRKNQVWDYFSSVAKENNCYIAFGTKHEKDGKWWNSCIIVDRKGEVAGIYDKNYPTVPEMNEITASDETPIIQCDFGKIACAVCFDLNFDELRVKYEALNPDIILFPSMYHGGLEQAKWAYSCRSFFVCAYGFLTEPSEIRDPFGDVVATSTNHYNYAVTTINLDRILVHLDHNWKKLEDINKKYGDKVMIKDPGRIGAVMITSEHEAISAADIVKEFDMETLDEYFNRSRKVRKEQLSAK